MNIFADLATHLTETNRGKHFIGDFLPPDELERFMETFKVNGSFQSRENLHNYIGESFQDYS